MRGGGSNHFVVGQAQNFDIKLDFPPGHKLSMETFKLGDLDRRGEGDVKYGRISDHKNFLVFCDQTIMNRNVLAANFGHTRGERRGLLADKIRMAPGELFKN